MSHVYVLVEHDAGQLAPVTAELITAARPLGAVSAVVVGGHAEELAPELEKFGAVQVVNATAADYDARLITPEVDALHALGQANPAPIIIAADRKGNEIAGRLGDVVFPGGGVDSRDFPPRSWDSGEFWAGRSVVSMARRMGVTKYKAHALVFAAARELFEESGTLLVVDDDGPIQDSSPFHDQRQLLETHEVSFTDFLAENSMKVDSDLLIPWARWVGSSGAKNWFDTFFFVALLPEGQTPDGETGEAADANWFPPRLLLDGWKAGLVRLVIPTWAQLQRLAQYDSVAEVIDAASLSDTRPVIGDPKDDPRYHDFFTTTPIDRITWCHRLRQ